MHYLSLCLFIKDENQYLPEWVEFHKLVGVEHFFIYDNDSRIPVSRTLEEDVREGTVTVTRFPGSAQHIPAYSSCLQSFGKASRWIGFIDGDEFLCPSVGNDLKAILQAFEPYGGLGVNWVMFGSSGHQTRPPGLQIDGFTLRPPDDYPPNTHIKSIVQPRYVRRVLGTHTFEPAPGTPIVNERFQKVDGPFSPFSVEKIRLNHYWTRSRGEFADKIRRGTSDGHPPRVMEDCDRLEIASTMPDHTIRRFSDALKARLAGRAPLPAE